MKKKKSTRVIRNLLIAAVLVSVLAVTALAAGNGFGLRDYLTELGMKNAEAVEKLSVVPAGGLEPSAGGQDAPANGNEGVSVSNRFAKYTVSSGFIATNT